MSLSFGSSNESKSNISAFNAIILTNQSFMHDKSIGNLTISYRLLAIY